MNEQWNFLQCRHRYYGRLLAIFILLVGPLGTCAFASSGQVIDEESGKPLPDVFVIARWTSTSGPFFVHSSTVCYNLEITQTDKQGRYSISDFSWNFNPLHLGRERDVDFYLPGYETSPNRNLYDENNMVLRRYSGDVSKRLHDLHRETDDFCVPELLKKRKLGKYHEAVYQEAAQIAKSPEQIAIANFIRDRKDTMGLPLGSLPRNPDGSIRK